MRHAIIAVIVGLVSVGIWQSGAFAKPTEYIRQTETKEVKVEVDLFKKQVADSKAASSTEIEARAKAAYENAKYQAELEVELQVTSAYRAELEEKEKKLMEEASF